MQRFLSVILIALFLRPVFCAAASNERNDLIESLIQTLSDPDPSVRDRAGQKLMALGYTARPMLVKAARGPSPQIASRASDLLMKLPWWVPADPPLVQQYLNGYGLADNDERINTIDKLAEVPGAEPALLRLTQEEPSEAMSWQAATDLRLTGDSKIMESLRHLDLTDARVQVISLTGVAFLQSDRPKGIALLRRAIDEDSDSDGSDDEAIDFVYQLTVTDAVEQGKPADAIHLLRTRGRRAVNADPSRAIFGLFAFRADQNFIDGLEDDAAEFPTSLGRPEMIYALGRIERTKDDGSNLIADVFGRCAQSASLDSVASHARIGSICEARAWDAEARQEFFAVISTELRERDSLRIGYHGAAQLILARIAEVEEDHPAAADHLDRALQIYEHYGVSIRTNQESVMNPEEVRAQSDWHHLHIAKETGDTQTFDRLLRKFIDSPNPDSDSMIEVVNDLKSLGRKQEAESCFNKAYVFTQMPPAHRVEMDESFNNLAWLCARCGEHTDEAIKLAERALTIKPDNYGYIDTLASAYFAAGKPSEAVKLEKRALIMRPNDSFMLHQLQRFEKGSSQTQRHEDTKQN